MKKFLLTTAVLWAILLLVFFVFEIEDDVGVTFGTSFTLAAFFAILIQAKAWGSPPQNKPKTNLVSCKRCGYLGAGTSGYCPKCGWNSTVEITETTRMISCKKCGYLGAGGGICPRCGWNDVEEIKQ